MKTAVSTFIVASLVERLGTSENMEQIQAQTVAYGALREHYACPEE